MKKKQASGSEAPTKGAPGPPQNVVVAVHRTAANGKFVLMIEEGGVLQSSEQVASMKAALAEVTRRWGRDAEHANIALVVKRR